MKRFCLFRHEKQPVKIFLLWLKRIFLKKLHSAPLGLFSFEPKHTVGKHLYGINGMFLFLNWDYWVRTRRSQKGNTAFFPPVFYCYFFFTLKKSRIFFRWPSFGVIKENSSRMRCCVICLLPVFILNCPCCFMDSSWVQSPYYCRLHYNCMHLVVYKINDVCIYVYLWKNC